MLLSFLIYLYADTKNRVSTSLSLGLILTVILLYSAPSLFDTLFWLTSSMVYLPALFSILFTLCLISLINKNLLNKYSTLLLLAPAIMLLQTFGEFGAIASLTLSSLSILMFFVKKMYGKAKKIILITVFQLSGILINLLSPGASVRTGLLSIDRGLEVFIPNIFQSFAMFINHTTTTTIVFSLLFGIAMYILLPKKTLSVKIFTKSIILILSVSTILLFALAAANAYSQGGGTSLRNLFIPNSIIVGTISLFVLIVISFGLSGRGASTKIANTALPALTIILFMAFMIPSVVSTGTTVIRAMVMRNAFYTQREITIKNDLSANKEAIRVAPLEIILLSSEAEDVRPGIAEDQAPWVWVPILEYYGIPNNASVVIDQPNPSYCLNNPISIKSKYLCLSTLNTGDQ